MRNAPNSNSVKLDSDNAPTPCRQSPCRRGKPQPLLHQDAGGDVIPAALPSKKIRHLVEIQSGSEFAQSKGGVAKRKTFLHRTSASNARKVLSRGFKDATGSFMMAGIELTGVWFSNQMLDENEGGKGDAVLQVEVKVTHKELGFYEVKEAGRPNREGCIPASLLNRGRISAGAGLLEEFHCTDAINI